MQRGAGGVPHLLRVGMRVSRPVPVLRPQGRPRGLNSEGGIVGGENANWFFE
jgi:hypothetical protein